MSTSPAACYPKISLKLETNMNKLITHFLAALICFVTFNLNAYAGTTFVTGNELYQDLKDNYGKLYSLGYITGIADVGNDNSIYEFKFCIPTHATQGQLSDIVSKWLEQNPERRHYSASSLIALAFQEAFPCK
jgi:hypothetical protein